MRPVTLSMRKIRRRSVLVVALLVVLAVVVAGVAAVITRDSTLPDAKPPIVVPATLEQLDTSITNAEQYLDGMYKEISDDQAVQSEYYAMPLRVFFPDNNEWILLGQNNQSSIRPGASSRTTEEYAVAFDGNAFEATVQLNWPEDRPELEVIVKPSGIRKTTELWLGHTKLGVFHKDLAGTAVSVTVTDFSSLASLRYTVRHATQQALFYWQARGDKGRASKLRSFLVANGYGAGFDMRAIIFNKSQALPEDLPYNRKAYSDCDHLPPSTITAYPYESKACVVLGAYFTAGERDPFLQGTFALHMLQMYQKPDRQYNVSTIEEGWLQGSSPKDTSKHLQQQWERTRNGLPSCTPVECQGVSSGIRTFVFGALETQLGYGYGDDTSKRYADAAVVSTINAQIARGSIRMVKGDLYRPVYSGGYLAYWDNQGHFTPPDSSLLGALVLTVIDESAMPPEYLGVIPSNSETTFDAWAFLVRYRCLRFGVKCDLIS